MLDLPGASHQWYGFPRLLIRYSVAAALLHPWKGSHQPEPQPKVRTRGRLLMPNVSFLSVSPLSLRMPVHWQENRIV